MKKRIMPPPWKQFLLVKLPLATLALLILAQMLAWAMGGIAYRRHDLDLLALNVELSVTKPFPEIVIIGDSVTQDILKIYQIGAPDLIANLTTNQASGLAGAYLLIKRYLQANNPPRILLIASTPEFFTYMQDKATAYVYLKSVFRKPDEIAFLDNYFNHPPDKVSPALFRLNQTIGLKTLALFAPRPSRLLMGDREPRPSANKPKPRVLSASLETDIKRRGQNILTIPNENAKIIKLICNLATKQGFAIHFQNAPVAAGTREVWVNNEYLARFESSRKQIIEERCKGVVWDIGTGTPVIPNGGMRDAYHLARHDWTNVYAVFLDQLVTSLAQL